MTIIAGLYRHQFVRHRNAACLERFLARLEREHRHTEHARYHRRLAHAHHVLARCALRHSRLTAL